MGVKGQIPWNKGLGMDDSRVRKNIEARNETLIKKYGTLNTVQFRKNYSASIETKQKMSEAKKQNWQNPEYRKMMIEAQNRIEHFKKFGFSTLVVWEHELTNKVALSKRILEFNQKEVAG